MGHFLGSALFYEKPFCKKILQKGFINVKNKVCDSLEYGTIKVRALNNFFVNN